MLKRFERWYLRSHLGSGDNMWQWFFQQTELWSYNWRQSIRNKLKRMSSWHVLLRVFLCVFVDRRLICRRRRLCRRDDTHKCGFWFPDLSLARFGCLCSQCFFGHQELCGGGDLSELFKELDDEPLGTASIAQAEKQDWSGRYRQVTDMRILNATNIGGVKGRWHIFFIHGTAKNRCRFIEGCSMMAVRLKLPKLQCQNVKKPWIFPLTDSQVDLWGFFSSLNAWPGRRWPGHMILPGKPTFLHLFPTISAF